MSTRMSTRKTRLQNGLLSKPPAVGKRKENAVKLPTVAERSIKEKSVALGLKRKVQNDDVVVKPAKKRSAFGDITNAIEKSLKETKSDFSKVKLASKSSKKPPVVLKSKAATSTALKAPTKPVVSAELPPPPVPKQRLPRQEAQTHLPSKKEQSGNSPKRKTEEEEEPQPEHDVSGGDSITTCLQENLVLEDSENYVTASEGSPIKKSTESKPAFPEGVSDFDDECNKDIFAVPDYAQNIFDYYKEREKKFPVEKYMSKQTDVSRTMRSILVDWMVEVQESFELNHETLYLAVKLVDLYLSKVVIKRENLQLVGSTAVFLACKFDERIPPYVDDFLYICDDAYKRKELLALEIDILKTLGFDLGIPLSYRFLRRYARCGKVSMEDLTFARYILELSLTDYELIDASDSVMGAAALCLALTIKGSSKWTPTLQYYSGYTMDDLYHYLQLLHNMLTQPPKEHVQTIRNKYSHKIFFEVAKTPIPESLNI